MSDFKILEKDYKITENDTLWGFQDYIITKEDIEALLNGQKIYGTINHEYAFTIELGGEDICHVEEEKVKVEDK